VHASVRAPLGNRQERPGGPAQDPASVRHHKWCRSASPDADTADLLESLVFDVFVVAGVLAVFGVVALIAKGVERL
jgi:hypothetical protein